MFNGINNNVLYDNKELFGSLYCESFLVFPHRWDAKEQEEHSQVIIIISTARIWDEN